MMKNLFSLEGETAVVTGALGKLGPVWIEVLLDAGASVFAIDLPAVPVSEPFRQLESRYGKTHLTLSRADVTGRESLESACRTCIERYGVPGVLVNNAGIDAPPGSNGTGHRLEQIPFEVGREILEVNTLGMFLTTQVFGTPMLSEGSGSIINIGSLYAGVSPDGRLYDHIESDPPFLKPPMYGASKAAVINLTRYLATLWAGHGVRVNALSPGGVLGGQDSSFQRKFCERVPMGRMAVSEDLFGPLLFLASRASAYLTGTELVVDGGFTAW
jgi:NAD(P)-dependent dehydrogenase (short-subunit alcohol dehydrogenase family)